MCIENKKVISIISNFDIYMTDEIYQENCCFYYNYYKLRNKVVQYTRNAPHESSLSLNTMIVATNE